MINGDGSVVGDFVISTGGSPAPNIVTIWSSAMNAVAVYSGGHLNMGNSGALFYTSNNCTGTGYYLAGFTDSTPPTTSAPSNFIYGFNGSWYLISGTPQVQVAISYMAPINNSYACQPFQYVTDRLYQVANPIQLTIPASLTGAYSIQFR